MMHAMRTSSLPWQNQLPVGETSLIAMQDEYHVLLSSGCDSIPLDGLIVCQCTLLLQ